MKVTYVSDRLGTNTTVIYHQISFIFQNVVVLSMCTYKISFFSSLSPSLDLSPLSPSLPLTLSISLDLECVAFLRRFQRSSSRLVSWSPLLLLAAATMRRNTARGCWCSWSLPCGHCRLCMGCCSSRSLQQRTIIWLTTHKSQNYSLQLSRKLNLIQK